MRCKVCKGAFIPERFLQKTCSLNCAIEFTNQKKAKEWAVRKSEMKDTLKTHSDWSKELQIEINTIARLIDKDSLCVSSLTKLNDKYDAGHRFSVGSFPSLRFNLFNIHAQSVHQNQYLSGNPDGYDHGLETMYGEQYVVDMWDLRLKYPSLKLSIPELIDAKAKAKKIVKDLKVLDLVYPSKVRIELRKKYNLKIGIYK